MIEVQRILHPTDFSDCSQRALAYACRLSMALDAKLHILHVFSEPVPTIPIKGISFPESGSYLVELEREAAAALAKLPGSDWPTEQPVVRATRQGHPVTEIIQYAREMQIGMIVLGTHGRSGVAPFLLGSIADKIVKMAHCPVLTVQGDERTDTN